jgi:uncharacterized membrane protein
MPTVLIIVGLVFIVIGLVVFLWPKRESSRLVPQALGSELAEVLKEINLLLDKFDKRYRPGLVLMLIGLALVGSGIYLETVDAKNAAKKAGSSAALIRPAVG